VIDPAKLRAIVESEREVSFWGKTYRITPRVIEEVLGDGGQLIWLQPLNTRPNFYVLQVDSTWTLSNWGQPGTDGLLSDHLEEIHDAINEPVWMLHLWGRERVPGRRALRMQMARPA
jgi:hypothetical protein